VNGLIGAELERRVADAGDLADQRLRGTVISMALIIVIGGAIAVRGIRRVNRDISRPLEDLERMVLRLSGREHGVRVAPGGPREVRLIGAALNDLAEGQERGRAVEEQVRAGSQHPCAL